MPRWMRWVVALAGVRALAGLLVAIAQPLLHAGTRFPPLIFLLQTLVFGATAFWLILGGRHDARSGYLGGFYLLIANAFAGVSLRIALRSAPGALAEVLRPLALCPLESFLPAFVWNFLDSFPRVDLYQRSSRLPRALARLGAISGAALLIANLALSLAPTLAPAVRQVLAPFSRNANVGAYWAILFAQLVPAIPYMIWKARRADASERRRVRLFVLGFALGAGPMFVQVLLESLVPAIGSAMSRPGPREVAAAILFPALLTMPITTAYAIRVHHALDVRLVIRKAFQYVFARYTLAVATLAPFVMFATYVYARREQRVADLLRGREAVTALSLTTLGLVAITLRRTLLRAVDRRFFREQYDSHLVLSGLVEGLREARTAQGLMDRLAAEVQRAFHVDTVAVLVLEPENGRMRVAHGNVRGLESGSALAGSLLSKGRAVDVDWTQPGSTLRALPGNEREWLVDGGFRLIVPLVSQGERLVGMVALGDKQSDLPYSREDRLLLDSMAASVALVLEHNLPGANRGAPGGRMASEAPDIPAAAECEECGRIEDPDARTCTHCRGRLIPSPLPRVLVGKFSVQSRVGAGGMGVVYRATDLSLDRQVALKCLPRPEPAQAAWLRREARAMAAVSHPNLAQIHGAEIWHGMPILILEYMEGGTLASALAAGTLPVREALELGLGLAEALHHLHERGIIHRDIKPGNLGYTRDRVPKLLDFGIARMLLDSPRLPRAPRLRDSAPNASGGPTGALRTPAGNSTERDGVVGTPIYMSPEALRGDRAEPAFDLWGLAMVLYEAIAGRHPLMDPATDARLWDPVPDIRSLAPDCPESVAEFFIGALSAERARRPSRALELRARLERVKAHLAARTPEEMASPA